MKAEERDRFTATVPFFLACIILFLFFSKEVILLATIYLVVGDTAAAYFGSRLGRIRFWNGKSLEGLIAFMLFGILFSLLFLILHTWSGQTNFSLLVGGRIDWMIILLVAVGALLSAITEFLIVPTVRGLIDDNLLVPLMGAVGILLIGMILNGDSGASILIDTGTILE